MKFITLILSLLMALQLNAQPSTKPIESITPDLGFSRVKTLSNIVDSIEDENYGFSPISLDGMLILPVSAMFPSGKAHALRYLGYDSVNDAKEAFDSITFFNEHLIFEMAYSAWAPSRFEKALNPDFKSNLESLDSPFMFYEGVENGVTDINTWASDKTHGEITQVVEASTLSAANFVLANAAYFKGSWTNTETRLATAQKNPSERIEFQKVVRASDSDNFSVSTEALDSVYIDRYTQGANTAVRYSLVDDILLFEMNFKLDEIERLDGAGTPFMKPIPSPYSFYFAYHVQESVKNGVTQYSVDVNKATTEGELKNLIQKVFLDETDSNPYIKDLKRQTMERIAFPKFELENKIENIQDHISKKMIPVPGATLEGKDFISQIFQKVKVRVDEKGAVAAAVTAAIFESTSVSIELPPPPTEVEVDGPFAFAIRHNLTNKTLFTGAVANPFDLQ